MSYVRLESRQDFCFAEALTFSDAFFLKENRWTLPQEKIQSICNSLQQQRKRIEKIDAQRCCLVKAICRIWKSRSRDDEFTIEVQKLFSEVQKVHDFIETHKRDYIEQAQRERRGIYIPPRISKVARAMHFNPKGEVFVHLNRQKQGDKKIGSGTYKKVKFAVNWESKKIFASASLQDEELFLHEKPIYSELSGVEGFVQCVDTVSYRKDGFMKYRQILEYYEGGDLGKAKILPQQRKQLMRKLIQRVAFMHRLGFIHRDLKPENIFLDLQGNPFIGDFGSMCKVEDEADRSEHCTTETAASPEYARAVLSEKEDQIRDATTFALDDWSLACTFCYICKIDLPWFIAEEEISKIFAVPKEEREEAIAVIKKKILKILASLKEGWFQEPEKKDSLEHLIWEMFAHRLSAEELLLKLDGERSAAISSSDA